MRIESAAVARLRELVGKRAPGWNLAVARIGVAIALLITFAEYAPRLRRAADPDILLIPQFDWMPEPSSVLTHVLLAVWLLSALGLLLGWRARVTGALMAAVLAFVLALDAQLYSNHLYLLLCLTLLLTVAESGARVLPGVAEDPARGSTAAAWPIVLLKCQLSIVYLFAALSKLNATFLSGGVMLAHVHGGVLPFPEALRIAWVLAPMGWLSVLVEFYLAFALWSSWRRGGAVWMGLIFHAVITLTMPQTLGLAAFSVAMLALYPLFFRTPAQLLFTLRASPLRRRAPA